MRDDIFIPRVSICQFSTFRWSFLEDVVRYASHGFDSIGIWRRKVDDFDFDTAVDLLYDSKVSVSSVHWAGGFTGDGQPFSDAIEDAIEAIQMASCLNADSFIIHPGSRNGHTKTHARRLLTSALNTLVPIAFDYGVKLALEPMINKQASSWTFMDCFEDTLELTERFSSESIGIVLDTYHVGFDQIVFEMLDQFVDRVELVQLADRNLLLNETPISRRGNESFRLPLGQGQAPIEAWLSKLQRLGYTGSFEVEVHGSEVQDLDYFQLLEMSEEYFSQPKIKSLLTIPATTPPPIKLRAKLN